MSRYVKSSKTRLYRTRVVCRVHNSDEVTKSSVVCGMLGAEQSLRSCGSAVQCSRSMLRCVNDMAGATSGCELWRIFGTSRIRASSSSIDSYDINLPGLRMLWGSEDAGICG